MKKKGYTIVELLAVIVILAVITSLGVGSVQIVSKHIVESNYKSRKSLIELKATEYANDTGFLVTSVDNLIKKGYLDADNESGEYKNPVNDKKINCWMVTIANNENNLYATLLESEEYPEVCPEEELIKPNMYIELNAYKKSDYDAGNHVFLTNNDWSNEDVVLEISFKDLNIQENDVEKIIWKTNSMTKEVEVNGNFSDKNTILVNAEEIINSVYSVEVYLNNNTVYENAKNVKIDKQKPIVYEDSMKVTLENAFTDNENILKATLSDWSGSGIDSYAVLEGNNDCTSATYTLLDKTSFEVSIEKGKIYYICAKDKVGNLAEETSSREVNLVNFIPPTIEALNDTLELGDEDYLFETNVIADFNIFTGSVSCDPSENKKSGEYDVYCTALSENGLASHTTFHVKNTTPAVTISE